LILICFKKAEVYNPRHRKARFLFGLADVAVLTGAFFLAYQTRLILPLERNFAISLSAQLLLIAIAIAIQLLGGLWRQIYEDLETASLGEITSKTAGQAVVTFSGLVIAEFLLKLDLSRTFLAIYAGYSLLGLLALRTNFGGMAHWIRQMYGAPVEMIVVGLPGDSSRFSQTLQHHHSEQVRVSELTPTEARQQLPARLKNQIVDEVIFAVSSDELTRLEEVFLLCEEEGVKTHVLLDFFPHVNSNIFLDQRGDSRLLTFTATPQDELRLLLKRGIDIAVSMTVLFFIWPLLLVVAVAIRVTSAGPAIYRQERCGLNGRRFVLYKFRSMVADADHQKEKLAHLNTKTTAFKIPNDPRLTSIGRILRKFSLDEFPQFWNVLKGDMSLVGPRPPVPEEVAQYERWQRRRLRMRPGLTCLWALHGRDNLDFENWMRMDMQYIDSWSLSLDWMILLRTIPSVVTGKGAN
jgi:exopolysaccharide biosynthesis polyprenyl glycosylphosphotransferase